jgi:hypothetical protein
MTRSATLANRLRALAAVTLLAGVLSGCSIDLGGGALCTFNVQNPHQSSFKSKYMDAKVTMSCTQVVTDVSARVKLQKQDSKGRWRDVAGSENSRDAPWIKAGEKFRVMTKEEIRCVPGVYRAAGRGGATYRGEPNSSAAWQYGQAIKVSCSR